MAAPPGLADALLAHPNGAVTWQDGADRALVVTPGAAPPTTATTDEDTPRTTLWP